MQQAEMSSPRQRFCKVQESANQVQETNQLAITYPIPITSLLTRSRFKHKSQNPGRYAKLSWSESSGNFISLVQFENPWYILGMEPHGPSATLGWIALDSRHSLHGFGSWWYGAQTLHLLVSRDALPGSSIAQCDSFRPSAFCFF